MRIVDRITFLQQPAGTLYALYHEDGKFGELTIKQDTINTDDGWFYQELVSSFLHGSSDDWDVKLMDAEHGGEVPMDYHCGKRDGMFDNDQRFVIYSVDDHVKLISRMVDALQMRLRS